MKSYDLNDQTTFYFIIFENRKNTEITGWTDDKSTAEFYLKFHNCKNYKLRKVKKIYKRIVPILNENVNNEIEIMNILTAEKGNKRRVKVIQIPMTRDEFSLVNDTTSTFCSNMIDYSIISNYMHKLKPKYQRALLDIKLPDIIDSEIYNNPSKFTKSIDIDQLKLLFKLLPQNFD